MNDYICLCSKFNEDVTKIKFPESEVEGVKQNAENLTKTDPTFSCKDFLMKYLKAPLTSGLREIILRKPSDPIDFLGQWLLHYRNCGKKAMELKEFEAELFHYREKLRMLDKDDSIIWDYQDQGEQEY